MKKLTKIAVAILFVAAIQVSAAKLEQTPQRNTLTTQTTVSAKQSQTVYICTGPHAKKFHKHSHCSGLNNCSGQKIAISLADAEAKGFTPCHKCY